MFAGTNRHYVVDRICGRHFAQTVDRAGLPSGLAKEVIDEVAALADAAMQDLEKVCLPIFQNSFIAQFGTALPQSSGTGMCR